MWKGFVWLVKDFGLYLSKKYERKHRKGDRIKIDDNNQILKTSNNTSKSSTVKSFYRGIEIMIRDKNV